jgi:hypothetical protein
MRKGGGNSLYLEASEVEEVPASICHALGTLGGGSIFQQPYRGETPIYDGRGWRPTADALAEWETLVPARVVLKLHIDGSFVCMAARTGDDLDLIEVQISGQ